jgi:hypothetical protein
VITIQNPTYLFPKKCKVFLLSLGHRLNKNILKKLYECYIPKNVVFDTETKIINRN